MPKSKKSIAKKKTTKKPINDNKQNAEKVAKKKTVKSAKPQKPLKKTPAVKKVANKKVAKKKGVKKVAKKKASIKQAGGKKIRFFKVILADENAGDAHGRFSGLKPKQAANKALTSIIKTREKDGIDNSSEIKFSIIECTRGSKQKRYYYTGQRFELDEPMRVPIKKKDGEEKIIIYKFNNKVMKDKNAIAVME